VRALNDVEGVEWSVARALGNIGDPRAVEALIAALARNEQWEALQGAVAEACEKMGDTRVALVATLEKNDGLETLRVMAVAEALRRIRDTRAIEPLVSALQDKEGSVRQAAAGALGEIRDVQAVEPLSRVLNDTHTESTVRQAAAKALGVIGGAQAIDALEGALKDLTAPDHAGPDVRRQAAWALVEARRRIGAVEIFARLSIEAGEQQGRIYELRDSAVSIGRYRDNDIVLADRLVAKRHARLIWQEDGSYEIDDLGAFTGIMLNGRRLTSYESQPLHDGDRIQIGQTVLVFRSSGR